MDSVLDFLDDGTKNAAFEHHLAKLHTTTSLDLDALRVCIRLSPPVTPEEVAGHFESNCAPGSARSPAQNRLPHEQIWDLILSKISREQNLEVLYKTAEICLGNNSIAAAQINRRIYDALGLLLSELCRDQREIVRDETQLLQRADSIRKAAAYLRFLQCSFWLPRDQQHLIHQNCIGILSRFIGIDGLDHVAQDALSALFALLKSGGSIVVAYQENPSKPWLKYESTIRRFVLNESIVDQTFWNEIKALGSEFFTSNSSHIFRTWFQWISQVVDDGVDLECLNDDLYWSRLQLGLLKGFADQRKYCLAIIRQSLLAARRDVFTPTLQFQFVDRKSYLSAYEQFSVLFETIVLDRYQNQVQACLPELTILLGSQSKISSTMATTLLAAALDSKIQEGIRKTVGNWYISYVVENKGDCRRHISFLTEGFLPWATEGSLFTSTLSSTRTTTACAHGSAIVNVVASFVTESQDSLPPNIALEAGTSKTEAKVPSRLVVVLGVIRFILNTSGRIFQPAILYLMEGLVKGLQACPEGITWKTSLIPAEINEIFRLSRLPGLPEISSDLQSMYCRQLCDLVAPDWKTSGLSGCNLLNDRILELEKSTDETSSWPLNIQITPDVSSSLGAFLKQLEASKHQSIQGGAYAAASKSLVNLLDQAHLGTVDHDDLLAVLSAFWEEAERREFGRSVAIHLPPLLFHPGCVYICVARDIQPQVEGDNSLKRLLSKAMKRLQALAKGRAYILSVLVKSLRKAVFYLDSSALRILPFEDFIIDFLNDPPSVKSEFLFELAAAEKLQVFLPHRTYSFYYGQREWHAYAALIDLLHRFPEKQLDVAKRILDRLLEPWKIQQAPILIKSKWKDTLQLQAMLLLSDFCITEPEANDYLESFMHALILEPWPRYRFLLEWIVARIFIRFSGKTSRILTDLGSLDDSSPIRIASLIKLGLLVAPFESENFAVKLATHLNYYSASPKVQIRHEANFAFPIVFDLAEEKDWTSIINNPAFETLNAFIRRLDKFNASPWTIRTLKLDAVRDFTLFKIFQGQYLSIESPENEKVACEDFNLLFLEDEMSATNTPPGHIRLVGTNTQVISVAPTTKASLPYAIGKSPSVTPAFLQTKSGFDLDSLHPSSGPPSTQNKRPASVILVASLIDNPTNLGGLSRISESFGLEALYINDVKKTGHKDFKATSVTSEKHLPIEELKIPGVPDFLLEAKRKGYEVVGIEQTDRSGILGTGGADIDGNERNKDLGTLPKKCVLVLGSEKGGISPEVLAVVDRCVEIKTVGVTRSLNVQTAGGIAVYEWWREWGDNQ
ncbi:Nn.00g104380.m01.CDS01 [Neocucurbitaria sp. VM-36]